MKKVLIFSGNNDFNALELALENVECGNQVVLIQCDKTLQLCQHNRFGNPIMCAHCKHAMKNVINKIGLDKKVKLLYLSDLLNDDDSKAAQSFSFSFNSVKDIKAITYQNVEVGQGAFSSYVTFTRNVMPDMTPEFKDYISFLIRKEVEMCHAIDRLHKENRFELLVLHNGRFAQFKPLLGYAREHRIDYICTEQRFSENKLLKDIFYNNIPHDIEYVSGNVIKNWEKGDPNEREIIGRDFFERRKKGLPAGDKVYTKDQKAGTLPDGWDDGVENIAIFNSSEDEFLAISKEYDSYLLFPNQYVALQTIFEHYKGDKTKHFYLRIHPNLKNVPYKSHVALYKLHYDNVTIIPANSNISSYAILDNCDKVIIFDSTMGVEATYAGKPVIALSKYFYTILDMVHTPSNPEELWKLIEQKDLPCKMNDNVIKYGYFMMHQNYPEVSKVPYKYVCFTLFGKTFTDYSIMKLFGSYKMNVLVEFFLNKIKIFSQFKKLPCTEPYQG